VCVLSLCTYFALCDSSIVAQLIEEGHTLQSFTMLLRSYHWCCYAAIIGAATQLLLCATILILSSCARSRSSSSSVFPQDHRASIIGAATTADQQGRQCERGRVRLRRPCHEAHEEKYTEICKRNEDVTDSLHAMPECGGLSKTSVQQVK